MLTLFYINSTTVYGWVHGKHTHTHTEHTRTNTNIHQLCLQLAVISQLDVQLMFSWGDVSIRWQLKEPACSLYFLFFMTLFSFCSLDCRYDGWNSSWNFGWWGEGPHHRRWKGLRFLRASWNTTIIVTADFLCLALC